MRKQFNKYLYMKEFQNRREKIFFLFFLETTFIIIYNFSTSTFSR